MEKTSCPWCGSKLPPTQKQGSLNAECPDCGGVGRRTDWSSNTSWANRLRTGVRGPVKEMSAPDVIKAWINRNKHILDKEEIIRQAVSRFGCSKLAALEIYNSLKEEKLNKIQGGKGADTDTKQVDPNQLAVGIAVEMEHTDNPRVAAEIALDHLTENPAYYTELVDTGIADEKAAIAIAKKTGVSKKNEATQIGGSDLKKKFALDPDEEDDLEKFLMSMHKELPRAMQVKQGGRFSKLGMLADIAKWYEEKGFVTEKQYEILKKHVIDKMKDPAYILKHLQDLTTEGHELLEFSLKAKATSPPPQGFTADQWKSALKRASRRDLKKKIMRVFQPREEEVNPMMSSDKLSPEERLKVIKRSIKSGARAPEFYAAEIARLEKLIKGGKK